MNVLFTALLSEGSIIDLDGTIWIQLGLFAVAFFVFRLQAGEERDRLRAEGKRLERTVLDRVGEETDKLLADADAKLKTEASKLRTEIDQSIPALAKQIASKMLSREVQ